ncbi:MAG: cytochrome c maturation protein CcmE [Bacteroidetes bacterium]|nr:cytochrome c maturation protein CcmE [Bacteroidota bacterium]
MNLKVIVAGTIIVGALIFGATTFMESNIEYMDFESAQNINKKVQVKGKWVKEKESSFDASKSQFTFYMVDDNAVEMKVVLDGAKPNNFEIATEVVAKGRFKDGYFHANELLTKCPSKYEGDGEAVKKTL